MKKSITTGLFAIGLLLVGALAGVAGTQAFQRLARASYINSGLFAVAPGEGVSFHVVLDDNRAAPPAHVALKLIDQAGTVVAEEQAVLQPGQSTTLQSIEPGLYRAQARVLEPLRPSSARRSVVGTVEIFDASLGFAAVQRVVCAPKNEPKGGGSGPQ